MDSQKSHLKTAVLALSGLLGVTLLSAIIPASWFGVSPPAQRHEFNLSMLSNEDVPVDDTTNKKDAAWRVALQNKYTADISTLNQAPRISEEENTAAQKRLDDPNNLTASFAKNAYVASAYLEQNNITDPKEQDALMKRLIEEEKQKVIVTTYTESDIHINTKETPSSIRAYGNALGALINKVSATEEAGKLDISYVSEYNTTKDENVLEKLKSKREVLSSVTKTLTSMSVPKSAVSYHVLALNRISEYYTVIDSLSKADSDPLRASIAVPNYIPTLEALFGSMNAMRAYFKDSNISFTTHEPGKVFNPIQQ